MMFRKCFLVKSSKLLLLSHLSCNAVTKSRKEVPEDQHTDESTPKEVRTPKDVGAHTKALGPDYPQSDVKKVHVPVDSISWDVELKDYFPTIYTAPRVLEKPDWADPDVNDPEFKNIKFNKLDGEVNRKTRTGESYTLFPDGTPRNPIGRTGMAGRGLLGKWGPNHAADPIVTRWKRDDAGQIMSVDSKNILEFISISRRDTGEWAIPGGMVDNGEHVSLTLKREFGEEALNSMEEVEKESTKKHIEELFSKGILIYQGYVDDPRNTDNAWMETSAFNFHDNDGTNVGKIPLSAGDDAAAVRWLAIDEKLDLYASHIKFIEQVCTHHKAYFVK